MFLAEGLNIERKEIMINLMGSDVERRWACFWGSDVLGLVELSKWRCLDGKLGGDAHRTEEDKEGTVSCVSVRPRCKGISSRVGFSLTN